MLSISQIKEKFFSKAISIVVLYEFYHKEPGYLITLLVNSISLQILFRNVTLSFCLLICLELKSNSETLLNLEVET